MALTTVAQLEAARASARKYYVSKPSQAIKAAGSWTSLWGATPPTGAGEIPTAATAGAIPFTNPSGSDVAYLARLQAYFTFSNWGTGVLGLADRLWHNSGLSGTSTSLQAINGGSVTRPDGAGADNELWIEWYTPTGSQGGATPTITYVNQSGATASVVAPWVASPAVNQMLKVPLAAGDTGVRSVTSLQFSLSSNLTGNFGLTILRRIAEISCPTWCSWESLDAYELGLPQIPANACLFFLGTAGGTQSISRGQS